MHNPNVGMTTEKPDERSRCSLQGFDAREQSAYPAQREKRGKESP